MTGSTTSGHFGRDELRPVTSLFADVVGSTSLGERLEVSEVKALIGECVSRMCDVVERLGGHVGAYMGDGIAGFFGLYGAREDDVERAALAALEIRDAIRNYAAEVQEAWGVSDFSVRVGLNHGRVAVGKVGAGDPQWTALGDPVNVAARLQASAAPGVILLGESVAARLRGRFGMTLVGELRVKGRDEAVLAWELDAADAGSEQPQTSRFIGRKKELDALASMLELLDGGRGQIGILIGEGGIGKTRLVAELGRRLPSGVTWLAGTCDSIEERQPFAPFVEPLRSWLGVTAQTPLVEVRVKLLARGKPLLGDDFDAVAPNLARLLGTTLEGRLDRRVEGFPLEVLTGQLHWAYRTWLGALASTRPVVLTLDNLDAAGEATAEFAAGVLPVVDESAVLIIATMRRAPGSPCWKTRLLALAEFSHRTQEIPVGALCDEEALALVAAIDADAVLNEHLRQIVVDRAEGNPLFLQELVATVSSQAEGDEIPVALEALLLARIDCLSTEAKDWLQAAAILGREFSRDVLVAMMEDCSDVSLAQLLRDELIVECGRSPMKYSFRHGLLREAALATLTPERRRDLHRLAAGVLLEQVADHSHASALAHHYVASGDIAAAVEIVEQRADQLALVFQYEDAVALLSLCLDELGADRSVRIRLTAKQARFLSEVRRFDDALAILNDVVTGPEVERDEWEATLDLARAYAEAQRGAPRNALELTEAILRSVSSEELRLETEVLRARLLLETGDVEGAGAAVDQLDVAHLAPALRFDAVSLRAGIAALRQDLDSAETWSLEAERIADRSGSLANLLTAKRHCGLVCLLKGYVSEGFALLKSVYDRYESLGFVGGQLESAVSLLHLSALVGELELGAAIGERMLRTKPGSPWEEMLLANLAGIEFERGSSASAESLADRVLRRRDAGPPWSGTSAHLVLIATRIASGQLKAAEEGLRRALNEAVDAAEIAMIRTTQAEVALKEGDLDSALSFVDAARDGLGAVEPALGIRLNRVCDYIQALTGDQDAADRLREHIAAARQMGLRLEEARALVSLGSLDPEAGAHHFAEAERIFVECGCRRGLVELEEAKRGALTASAR